MIDIVKHIHQYVPIKEGKVKYRVFLGGDQLTAERARSAQRAKIQSPTFERQLQGLIPKVEDCHARVRFFKVHML